MLFKPGTDLALANGILHLLVADGRIHTPFIDENVVFRRGIEDLKQIGYGCFDRAGRALHIRGRSRSRARSANFARFLADYTPDRVSDITGVPVEQIRALANLYGDQARGTVSLWCMGVNQHVRGTWMNNLITDLHLITGKICRPGANPLSLTGQPSACGTAREVGTSNNRLPADMVVTNPEHRAEAERIWKLPPGTIPAQPGYHAVDMFRALKRGDLKALWIQTTNPWVTLPNRSRFDRAPGRWPVHRRQRHLPDADDGDRRPDPAGGGVGRARRRVRQHRTSHATVEQDDRSAGRGARGRLGRDRGGEADGHGRTSSPGPRTTGTSRCSRSIAQFGVGHGKDLASYAQLKQTRGHDAGRSSTARRRRIATPPDTTHTSRRRPGAHFYKATGYGEKAAFWLRPYHPPAEVARRRHIRCG